MLNNIGNYIDNIAVPLSLKSNIFYQPLSCYLLYKLRFYLQMTFFHYHKKRRACYLDNTLILTFYLKEYDLDFSYKNNLSKKFSGSSIERILR